MSSTRAAFIKHDLDAHFLEVGAAVSTLDVEEWQAQAHEHGPHATFGWSWPIPYTGPSVLIPFCPELIAAQTEDLDDGTLIDYLWVIKWVCDSHCHYWGLGMLDPEERHRHVEEELLEAHPRLYDAWNRVQFRILDTVCT